MDRLGPKNTLRGHTNAALKRIPKKTTPTRQSLSSESYIQAGAFGIKKNADSLLKKLQDNGFSPSIHPPSGAGEMSEFARGLSYFRNRLLRFWKMFSPDFGHWFFLIFVHGFLIIFVHGFLIIFVHGVLSNFVHGFLARIVHGFLN